MIHRTLRAGARLVALAAAVAIAGCSVDAGDPAGATGGVGAACGRDASCAQWPDAGEGQGMDVRAGSDAVGGFDPRDGSGSGADRAGCMNNDGGCRADSANHLNNDGRSTPEVGDPDGIGADRGADSANDPHDDGGSTPADADHLNNDGTPTPGDADPGVQDAGAGAEDADGSEDDVGSGAGDAAAGGSDALSGAGDAATGGSDALSGADMGAPEPPVPGADSIYDVDVPRAGSWYVSGGRIYHKGAPVVLRGVNWFGLETPDRAPHGLWSGRTIADFLDQMGALGFNALRLPVSPDAIREGYPTASWAQSQGMATGREALIAVLDAAEEAGVLVLLDVHTCDSSIGGGFAPGPEHCPGYTLADWHDDLATLGALALGRDNVVGVDLFNEPHGLTWSEWSALAAGGAEAVLTANPRILVFVEGVGNASDNGGVDAFWGGNLVGAKSTPPAIPPSRLVYSPHTYGPSVYPQPYFSAADFPANMPAIWDTHFGALAATTPLAVGEFGGKYDESAVPGSVMWLDAFVDYMQAREIEHFFYWSLNPNSGDTGGILLDDWTTPNQDKLDALAPLLAP